MFLRRSSIIPIASIAASPTDSLIEASIYDMVTPSCQRLEPAMTSTTLASYPYSASLVVQPWRNLFWLYLSRFTVHVLKGVFVGLGMYLTQYMIATGRIPAMAHGRS